MARARDAGARAAGAGAAGEIRLLVVRPAQPVRELRVRRRTLWRVATLGMLALWAAPLAVLAGIASQAREDRALLALHVQALTTRTARLSFDVSSLERTLGVAAAMRADTSRATPLVAASVERALATDGWVDDLERRVGSVRGRFVSRLRTLPTGMPILARLSSGFGWRANPFGRGTEWHPGLDIPAPYGAPVRATADGVVERAGWRSGYGTAVEIRHADGFTTLFGHLSAAVVHDGQRIARGQVIGRVGNEGRSTGPHVHYEVRHWGTPVDPRRVRFAPVPSDSSNR